ncbi:MAG: MFS transporter, partial [Candidatus Scatosoma sp.]
MSDRYKKSRILYIIEAALEYFISIAVGTVYLAKLATYIGIPDWLTGILTSFVSLGCAFQIFAVFLGRYKPVKTWVTIFHIVSQLLFTGLYFIPAFKTSVTVKTVLFIVTLLCAQIIHNVINSPKTNWFMSLVDDKKRGAFTANKEIVSLVGGMLFSYGLGIVFDYFENTNQNEKGFILCGIGLGVLMALHSLTLIFSLEKPAEKANHTGFKKQFEAIFKNKNIFKIVLVSVLWNVANYATISFSGTYQNNELGFSLKFASAVVIVGSLARVMLSKPLGRYADKHSFSRMLCICFIIEIAAFGCNIFT